MKKQHLTVELDDETMLRLAALGEPIDVLVRLAHSAADGVRHPQRPRRDLTDASLQLERDNADIEVEAKPSTTAGAPTSSEGGTAKVVRASLVADRKTTDRDLSGERTIADALLIDQREANEQMVKATIRAHELATEADEAKVRAERNERELREVAEVRELFIGILSHDLRNPLSAITMAASLLLQRGRLDEEDAQTAQRIVRATRRITRMISQLLDLTRARLGGGLAIEPVATDLSETCRHVVEELNAPIELNVEGDLTGIWDPDRVAEALSNVVGNAVEYAAPQTAVVVRARGTADEVVIEIENEGAEIPPDRLPFLFEPFRRGKPREKSTNGNLGLGLYISQQIVLAHGGTLAARSTDGRTTFTLRLPRTPRGDEDSPAPFTHFSSSPPSAKL
jgi:signal transduction histidine kinase